jgi:hypothetical protein
MLNIKKEHFACFCSFSAKFMGIVEMNEEQVLLSNKTKSSFSSLKNECNKRKRMTTISVGLKIVSELMR